MPTIQIDCSEIGKEKKAKVVAEVTKLLHELLNIPEQAFHIIIREHSKDNLGVGGKLLSERDK